MPLKGAAKEVLDLYPAIISELEAFFGWNFCSAPSVILINKRDLFLKMADNPISVAFAIPEKNLIVIDYSKMRVHPFRLETTLKHELCHLLLHQYVKERLSRWLEEGLCQWVSNGMDEIIMNQNRSLLIEAALSNKFIPLRMLRHRFPRSEKSLILAYEESKNFVEYIVRRFGKEGLMAVLKKIKTGEETETAIQKALFLPLETLEQDWHRSLTKNKAWFIFLTNHLYEILFALMAFITLCAFVRIKIKKKNYSDSEIDADF
jgi:hypothetical protein